MKNLHFNEKHNKLNIQILLALTLLTSMAVSSNNEPTEEQIADTARGIRSLL